MNRHQVHIAFASALLFIGCQYSPNNPRSAYRGPGTIKSVHSLYDVVYLGTRHYLQLTNFPMSAPFRAEFLIENLPNLPKTKTAILQLRCELPQTQTSSDLAANPGHFKWTMTDAAGYVIASADAGLNEYLLSSREKNGSILSFCARPQSFSVLKNTAPFKIAIEYTPSQISTARAHLELMLTN
jgi:hypothetical protein